MVGIIKYKLLYYCRRSCAQQNLRKYVTLAATLYYYNIILPIVIMIGLWIKAEARRGGLLQR